MPYLQHKNEVTMRQRDDEERTRNRTFRIDSAFTVTDDMATALSLCTRGTVDKYAYRQVQSFDGALELGDDGDVNDKTNLVFLDVHGERVIFPLYDLHQDCFVAETGALARVVKDKDVLEDATGPVPPVAGDPEWYLNQLIDWVLDGTIIIGSGEPLASYVEGYKVD